MKRLVLLAALNMLCLYSIAAAAPLAITGNEQRDIMLTIYNGSLGLVKDTRETHLDGGTLEVKFMDVAAQIDPTSVHLRSLSDPSGVYGVPVANQKIGVYLELKNSQARGLGIPLPKGKVRVYKADASGSQQLIGEDWIDHTPKDERVKIKMGDAFDVVGERVQKDWRKIGSSLYEVEWDISLRNHKKEAITVDVIEPVPGDWEVLRSTVPHEKVEAFTMRFRVPVPKDGEAKLNYRVRVRF